MKSDTNPISIFEQGLIAAIQDTNIDDYYPFATTGSVDVELGTDQEIVGRMMAENSAGPMVRVRWSPFESGFLANSEADKLRLNLQDESSGATLWTIYVLTQAPFSRIEAKLGAGGLYGYQDIIPAIAEQIHPMSFGFKNLVNDNILNTGAIYFYIASTEVLSKMGVQAREGASVIALKYVAFLGPFES